MALAWDVERPGWLDPTVLRLARALGEAGVPCDVVTLGAGPTATRTVDGVEVTWVAEPPPVLPATGSYDIARVLATCTRTTAAAERRCRSSRPDTVLAFGWQTAWTATTLRSTHGMPVVAVMDSTAPGRADGELDETGRVVAQVEWWLTYEARQVVAPVDHVAAELRRTYRLPPAKVAVVPHGVDVPDRRHPAPDEVVVVGRREVLGRVRRTVAPVHVRPDPAALARAAVVAVMDDASQDVCLAAMAAGAAVVVPDDGPLRGLVHAGRSGDRVARDPQAVASLVADLLADPGRRGRRGDQARRRVQERHAWPDVARRHVDIAGRAVTEEAELAASATPDRPLRPMLLRSPLLGLVREDGAARSNGRRARRGQG